MLVISKEKNEKNAEVATFIHNEKEFIEMLANAMRRDLKLEKLITMAIEKI